VSEVWVEIVDMENDNEVIRRMGPMSSSKADKVLMGAMRNMNIDRYSARIVDENGTEQ
jgi:hypothetical protein